MPGLDDTNLQAPVDDGGAELDQFEPTDDLSQDDGQTEDQTFSIDGKEYRASELKEYIKGGMLEKDYRQKTSSLAEERKQMAELRQAAEAWQTVQQYPELMKALGQQISQILQGGPTPSGQPQPNQDDLTNPPAGDAEPWKNEMGTMRNQLAGVLGAYDKQLKEYNQYLWAQYYANREAHAQGQLKTLQEKYPYLYPDEVVAAFRDNQEADLEELAKLSHEHWQGFASQREKANLEKRKANANARVETGPKGGAPASVSKTPQDYDEARRSALERLRKVGNLFRS